MAAKMLIYIKLKVSFWPLRGGVLLQCASVVCGGEGGAFTQVLRMKDIFSLHAN